MDGLEDDSRSPDSGADRLDLETNPHVRIEVHAVFVQAVGTVGSLVFLDVVGALGFPGADDRLPAVRGPGEGILAGRTSYRGEGEDRKEREELQVAMHERRCLDVCGPYLPGGNGSNPDQEPINYQPSRQSNPLRIQCPLPPCLLLRPSSCRFVVPRAWFLVRGARVGVVAHRTNRTDRTNRTVPPSAFPPFRLSAFPLFSLSAFPPFRFPCPPSRSSRASCKNIPCFRGFLLRPISAHQ